jgi:hypothetical protein
VLSSITMLWVGATAGFFVAALVGGAKRRSCAEGDDVGDDERTTTKFPISARPRAR